MPLVADPVIKGVWTNPGWTPGQPGVFALVIGVSRYDHLKDGVAAAPDTYDLGQLNVSALTAYRFFMWLNAGYALNGWPIAKVRLLLAPLKKGVAGVAQDELAGCDAAICAHAAEATFASCKAAIESWYYDMQLVQTDRAGRSIFFFSGHGLELRHSYQVLLPSDYLRPPTRPLNEAISTRNLLDCLPYLRGVSTHVLFIDACRNDHVRLRGLKVEGADILNEGNVGTVNPNYAKAVVYSTASGLQAYQPKANGISLFGSALLDGLKTKPDPTLDEAPIELRCRGNICTVEINNLTSYVKGRLDALIKAANESVVQVARGEVSSPGTSIDVAEIDNTALVLADPVTVTPENADGHLITWHNIGRAETFSDRATRARGVRRGPRAKPKRATATDRGAWFDRRYTISKKPEAPVGSRISTGELYNKLHDVLGAETVTIPWLGLQITGLQSGKKYDQSAARILSTNQARGNIHRVQVHFRINGPDPVGHVLTMIDDQKRRFGGVLPSDKSDDPIYQLEIDAAPQHQGGQFFRFAAYLSPQNTALLGKAANVWQQLRALSAVEASGVAERNRVHGEIVEASKAGRDVMAKKVKSPLSALVAGVALLRANRFDMLNDWLRNLAKWFPSIPDGPVLWTEQCRRIAARSDSVLDPALIPWFLAQLGTRDLPFTAEALGLAADILRDIKRGRVKVTRKTLDDAEMLADRFDRALAYFRDDGLFCGYAGLPDDLELAALVGKKQAKLPRSRGRR